MKTEKEQICKVGDEFFRLFKNQVVIVTITRAERMSLGHYVYNDDFRPYSTSVLYRTFCNRYFKDKELAIAVAKTKERISALRNEIEVETATLNELLSENRKDILGE